MTLLARGTAVCGSEWDRRIYAAVPASVLPCAPCVSECRQPYFLENSSFYFWLMGGAYEFDDGPLRPIGAKLGWIRAMLYFASTLADRVEIRFR